MKHIVLAAAGLACLAGPVCADDARFKSMALLAMGTGMEEVLPPTIQDGNYVDIRFQGVTAFGDTMSPGPGTCSLIHTTANQDRGAWVQLSVKVYDFAKVTGVRYLAPSDDFALALSRKPEDPAVDTISLDGPGWHCQRVLHIDPAKPAFAQHCDDNWQITVIGPADKASAIRAVETVAKACFPAAAR